MPAVDANQQLMFPLTRPAVISLCTDSGFILKGCSQNRQFPPPGFCPPGKSSGSMMRNRRQRPG
jgi:hypothetical protein